MASVERQDANGWCRYGPVCVCLVLAGSLVPTQRRAQSPPLDFVVAVDRSDGMAAEVLEVQQGLNTLAAILGGLGFDLKLILVSDGSSMGGICVPPPLGSGSCPLDENLQAYVHVQESVGIGDALQKVLDTYTSWSGSLRAGSRRAVMVVSDDDSDLPAGEFVEALIALDPGFARFQFQAIAGSETGSVVFENPGPSDCLFTDPLCEIKSAHEGVEYKELAGMRRAPSSISAYRNSTPSGR